MDTPLALLVFVPLLVAHLFYRLGFRAGCKEGRLQARDMVANYNQYLRSPTVRTLTRALYDFCDGREIDPERKAADAKQIVDDKLERRTKVEAFDAMDADRKSVV